MPTWNSDDFDIPNEEYWKKYAAEKSGGASISASPPRSAWEVLTDSIHDMMGGVGTGLNPSLVRGNQAAREEDLARQSGSARNQSPKQVQQTIRENQGRRANDVKEARASRALQMEDEQRRRTPVGRVAAKAAEMAGGIIGDINPTYAIGGFGANALERILGMGAITGANDIVGQGDERLRGIRDRGDPTQTLESVVGGGLIQGAGEGAAHVIKGIAGNLKIHAGATMPNYGDLLRTMMHLEGGGTIASPKISPKGAKGPAQVMDATARDPGFGIKPWNGKTEADRFRVGTQYLAALNHEFKGDSVKVLAAYNGGVNRVKHLITTHGEDWLHYMPHETQKYVSKGLHKMGKETGPEDLGQPDIIAGEQPSAADQAHANDKLAELESLAPPADVDEADMNEKGFVRSVVDDRWLPRDEAYEEAHQQWVDKNFPEGTEVKGYGHNIDENGNYKDPQAVRAIEDQDSEFAKARQTREANKARSVLDDHEKSNNLLDYHLDQAHDIQASINDGEVPLTLNELKEEAQRAAEIRDSIPKSHPLRYKGDELAGMYEDMVKSYHSDPITQKDPDVFDQVKAEKDAAEDFGGFLNEIGPREPANVNSPLERDTNPPASSSSFGTRTPEGINRKPPTKSPEGHDDPQPQAPRIETNKRLVLDKLGDALEQSSPIRREAEAAMAKERARRLAAVYKTRGKKGGEEGFHSELASLKGSMGSTKIESIRHWFSQPEIDQMYDIINSSPALQGYDTITAKSALKKLLGADYGEIPTKREVELLAKAMPRQAKIWRQLLENEEGTLNLPDGAVKSAVINTLGLTRTLKASFDVSAPGRQGLFLIGSKEYWKALPGMYKSFASEGKFHAIQEEIRGRDTFDLMNKAGLQITRNDAALADREEAFISQFAEHIPGVRNSERAYLAFLNKLRADMFDDFVKRGEKLGIDFIQDPHYLKSAARFINSATGRGDLGSVAKNGQLLANVLFSPKLMKSRIDLLNPLFYYKLHPKVRMQAAKHGLIYASMVMSMLGLAGAAGLKIEKDMRSSDFGKIQVGNTRFDVTGGLQPYVRFYAQFITGQQKGINDGLVRNLGWTIPQLRKLFPGVDQGAFKPTTRKDLLYKFFENKESPNASEITRLLQGTDAVGNPLTVASEVENLFAPLIASDTYHAWEDLGAAGGLFAGAFTSHGGGVQTYTPKVKKEKGNSDWKKSDFGGSTWSKKDFE